MNTVVFVLMIIAIVAATGPAHRRTARLPHAPFGSDVVDVDLERVLHDTNVRTSTGS